MTTTVLERPTKKAPKAKTRTIDAVERYALDVRDGRIKAGRAVRLACARHLRDLTRQNTPEFPYVFSTAAAQHIIEFHPEFITLENGDPFVLMNWQAFCDGSIFGWKRVSDGGRRFQTAYIETGKGSGKSPMLGVLGIYGLAFDDEQSAEIYSAAFDRIQASIIVNDAIRMATASPDLASILDIGKYNIAHIESGSFFRAVSSEHRSKSGPRPHMVLIDELHEHRDGTVVNKMRAGFKGRPQPLLMAITNAGVDRTSICWVYHQHSLSVLEGTITDEQWFGYVCQLDPCAAHLDEGYRQPKEGCEDCDDWTDPYCWPKVNPSLGVTIQPAYLQTQVDLAIAMPSERALVQRLNFCLWTEVHRIWISSDQWDACRVAAVSTDNAAARPCAAGLDLSSKLDLSALTVAIRFDDAPTTAPPETITIEATDDAGHKAPLTLTLNFSVELIPFCWLPAETLQARVTKERIPYDVWQRAKKLFVTPGGTIDHQAIYDFIVAATGRFKIQKLGYDSHDATMLAVTLRDQARLGDKIVEVAQGKKLSEAIKLVEVLVRSRRLRHDGHPVQAWCIANTEATEDRLGTQQLDKPKDQTKRIDLSVSAVMAVHQLMTLPAKRSGLAVHFLGARA